jgi:hypothetical protein
MRHPCSAVLALAAAGSFAVACGDRTGLFVTDFASPPDAGVDAAPVHDAGHDARDTLDAGITDALPTIDVVTPASDAQALVCVDSGATEIYVITEEYNLYTYDPPSHLFTFVGAIACPSTTPNDTPFSMAVDRTGVADIVYQSGALFRVSTATAACASTPFQPSQQGFLNFGMGFSGDLSPAGETLYIAADLLSGNTANGLASVDPSFVVHPIGPFSGAQVVAAELTGTRAGQLFAFYSHTANGSSDSYIGEIDKGTAGVIAETPLMGVNQGSAWAFAFWGGDFYMFVEPDQGFSEVWRYRPSDQSVTMVDALSNVVVGAGVSTCAPEQ